jgi:ATP-binding cassette, subfamily B, multidrug efflux pump
MMTPLYRVISMVGVIMILYFGGKNVLGTGWKLWDIAAFTTFLSCFTKLSVKSSKAAKFFNAVHKAQVSWNRIKPLMKIEGTQEKEYYFIIQYIPEIIINLFFRVFIKR